MGCPNCANRVRNSLISQNGVIEAIVQHTIGMTQVAAGGDGRHEYAAQFLSYGS